MVFLVLDINRRSNMTITKDKITIVLEEDEIYNLWDILAYAYDYDVSNKVLSEPKKQLLEKVLNALKDE